MSSVADAQNAVAIPARQPAQHYVEQPNVIEGFEQLDTTSEPRHDIGQPLPKSSDAMITKGGTSRVHGTGYWYGRDHLLSANDRSNSIAGLPKPRSGFFYTGGNIGGPIVVPGLAYLSKHDKLFFWAGVEGRRERLDERAASGVELACRAGPSGGTESLPGECRGG